MLMNIFEQFESNVRSYCRIFPDVFCKAKGSIIYSESGKEYIDFFAGAGSLNYGHNNDFIKEKLMEYITSDGLTQSLDMYTSKKRSFIEKFVTDILQPKDLEYKIQFCGSTGTNAVEAALKLARKVKKRKNVFSFMGGYHGMSLGSLSVTGNSECREGAGLPLNNVVFMPYPFGFMLGIDTIGYIEAVLNDTHSGIDKPAAIILETVQAEGGVVIAPNEWLAELEKLCKRHDILLICDEVQVGCGRTGSFFSFERAGINPDIVVLSKSISGYGLPMAILLIKPELDIWKPGEHNGTFRGNQLAFVGAEAALEYRKKYQIDAEVKKKEQFIKSYMFHNIGSLSDLLEIRGIGMIWGIDLSKFDDMNLSKKIIMRCYDLGLIIESVGRNNTVLKIMPPLTIEPEILKKGFDILGQAIKESL